MYFIILQKLLLTDAIDIRLFSLYVLLIHNIMLHLRNNHVYFEGKALQAGNLWYFFNRTRDQSGASPSGYWSPLDADEPIVSGGKDVGLKKTLIFYVGEAPQGIKTNWVMHEYHLVDGGGTSGTSSSSNRPSLKKRSHQRSVSVIIIFIASHMIAHVLTLLLQQLLYYVSQNHAFGKRS